MKLKDMQKEELEALSYTDLTEMIIKENKKPMNTLKVFNKICDLLELDSNEQSDEEEIFDGEEIEDDEELEEETDESIEITDDEVDLDDSDDLNDLSIVDDEDLEEEM